MKNYKRAVSCIYAVGSIWAAAAFSILLASAGILTRTVAGILSGLAPCITLILILRTRSQLQHARRTAEAVNFSMITSTRLVLQPIFRLRLLPLVEFASGDPELLSTFAVSYYVETEHDHILFDLGIKLWEEPEAVLYRNARVLAAQDRFVLDRVDSIVNSHAHNDHLAARPDEPILSEPDNPLQGKPFYAVEHLEVCGGGLHLVEKPTLLSPSAGLSGPLASELFIAGSTREQSLVFHLSGKGLVVIIGCGHPGVRLIVNACEQIFQQPVWGLIGGLHYPVTADRTGMGRVFHPQQLIGGPLSFPWQPISKAQVDDDIAFLLQKGVHFIALSAHDSCDWSLQRFLHSPLEAYVLRTGQEVVLHADG